MKKLFLITIVISGLLQAQDASKEQKKALRESRDLTWEANQELEQDQFVSAEGTYRKAISKSSENAVAPYNLGNALYNKKNYNEAFGRFKQAGEKAIDKADKHRAFHNMGNVFMKNKEYEKAVEAYKEALRNDPSDEETRYNLALAKEMLKKQQNDQKNDDKKDNKDQKEQKDQNKDKQNQGDKDDQNKQQNQDQKKDQGNQGDQGDQGDQQKEENKKGEGDEKQEQKKRPQPGEEQEKQQAPRPNQLSPQQIQNLLEAMQNEEKKVQEKLDAQKVKGIPTKNKKDW